MDYDFVFVLPMKINNHPHKYLAKLKIFFRNSGHPKTSPNFKFCFMKLTARLMYNNFGCKTSHIFAEKTRFRSVLLSTWFF